MNWGSDDPDTSPAAGIVYALAGTLALGVAVALFAIVWIWARP